MLAGCTQDTPNPAEPAEPEASAAIKCIAPGFPLVQALAQISGTKTLQGLYPVTKPKPLALALARVSEVAALWTVCKSAQAQAKVAAHTNIVLNDFRTGQLIGGTSAATAARVVAHINTMWQGVGFQAPNLPLTPGTGTDFGVGLFTPGQPLLVQTGSDNGAVQLPGNAFPQTTLVTIVQRPNSPNPFTGTGETVFPPFYEIIASNAGNVHYLNLGAFAVVGFCVDDVANPGILGLIDPAIAHVAVTEGSNPGGFEILDNATDAQYDQLGLDCERFSPPIGSLFDSGLRSFASNAPRYLRETVVSLLLPAKVQAAVGKTGLGGLARSLSPFGVTDRVSEPLSIERLDPRYASEEDGTTVQRRVQVFSGDNSVQNAPVTFSVATGLLGNGNQSQVIYTDADGQAVVNWALPAEEQFGSLTLAASVPGGASVTYTVAPAHDGVLHPLPCNLEGTITSLNSNTAVNVNFTNALGEDGDPISVFWLNFSGLREYPFEGGGIGVPYAVINPGQTHAQATFVTHPWILTSPGEPETCYGIFLPLPSGTSTVTILPDE
jgi:hypothetical protein